MGLTQHQLAEQAGTTQAQIQRLEQGERRLTKEWADRLAPILGVTREQLWGDEVSIEAVVAVNSPAIEPNRPLAGPDTRSFIPVKSAGRGGDDQPMFDEPLGYIPTPEFLMGVKGAYAIHMVGDSMSPRYEAGWLLYVHPHRRVVVGDDIVALLKGDIVLVKVYSGEKNGVVTLSSISPDHPPRKIKKADIVSMHAVIASKKEW